MRYDSPLFHLSFTCPSPFEWSFMPETAELPAHLFAPLC
jgi:hypothetical protein